ncbi:MAG: ATP-binding cassette domain-containing protein [Pseudomonadota bacterium]
MVQAHGVDVRFGETQVLSQVDLTVGPGEVVTVIGPNGSGKSTLLRVVVGLLQPDAGMVTRRPGLKIGYMPQRIAVDDTLPLTVRRFLSLGAPDVRRDEVDGLLREVGALHVAASAFQAISGGERQRVLLARALLRRPNLLVLDEPSAGVDVSGLGTLYRLIARLRDERGFGVLLVSHDLHIVMAESDTVVCLNRHVCCSGRPDSIQSNPEYLALFGGYAPDLAVYHHQHDHSHDMAGNVVDGKAGAAQ